jgi:hypothetical protein
MTKSENLWIVLLLSWIGNGRLIFRVVGLFENSKRELTLIRSGFEIVLEMRLGYEYTTVWLESKIMYDDTRAIGE